MIEMQDFKNKLVLITGAGGNLGKAVARAFFDAGATLALCDLHLGALDSVYRDSGLVQMIESDLRLPDVAETMAGSVIDRFGRIDVVAALTGGFTMGSPLHQTPPDVWEFMMKLNAGTVFNTAHAVVPHMRERGSGSIITVGARTALAGKSLMASYTASKAAATAPNAIAGNKSSLPVSRTIF